MKQKLHHQIKFIIKLLIITFLGMHHCYSNAITTSNNANEKCTVDDVIRESILASLSTDTKILSNQKNDLITAQNLLKNVKDRTKPVINQLTKADMNKLNEAYNRINFTNTLSIIESDYQRDLALIQELKNLATQSYKSKSTVELADTNPFHNSILLAWRENIDNDLNLPDQPNTCTLDTALFQLEKEPYILLSNRMDDFTTAYDRYIEILKKYNMEKELDYNKFNTDDREEIISLQKFKIHPIMKIRTYIEDIANIRLYAKMAKLIHDETMNDVIYSGGTTSSFVNSIENLKKNNKLNKNEVMMVNSWVYINEKEPSVKIKLMMNIKK